MLHINGVYTQRYKRFKKFDWLLFRGRFKAILVDQDGYLLQFLRYMHRNPIDMRNPLIIQLSDYYWSSYASYISKAKPIEWLAQNFTFKILCYADKHKGYAN